MSERSAARLGMLIVTGLEPDRIKQAPQAGEQPFGSWKVPAAIAAALLALLAIASRSTSWPGGAVDGVLLAGRRLPAKMPLSARDAASGDASAVPGSPSRLLARPVSPLPEPDADASLRFGDLMDLLGTEVGKPLVGVVGSEFARAFLADPELRAVYEEFVDAEIHGERRTAAAFLRRLAPLTEFQDLAARWLDRPESSAALRSLIENPRIRRLSREPMLALVDRRARVRAVQGVRSSSGRVFLANGKFAGSKAGGISLQAYKGSASARAEGPMRGLPFGSFAGAEWREDAKLPLPGGARPDERDKPGASAGLVAAGLPAPLDVVSNKEKAFCVLYRSLCDGDTIRAEFKALLYDDTLIALYGLWGACFKLGIFGQCAAACAATPGCVPIDGWTACLGAYQDEATCIAMCSEPGAECVVPSSLQTSIGGAPAW